MNKLLDKCKGVIYGQAIGDALGLGTEFLSKSEVLKYYPNGLNNYNQIIQDAHRRRWKIGDWTDDTDQMLCILDSLISQNRVDIIDVAKRIKQWSVNGGMGIGRLTVRTIYSKGFLDNPHAVSKAIWERTGKKAAPNGGIMRTSILGVWEYQNINKVKINAENICKITHYDPRCVGSCVALCVAISLLLQGISDFEEIIKHTIKESADYDERITEYLEMAKNLPLEAFNIDGSLSPEERQIGYTLKAMGAAFWTLKNVSSYEEGILKIIHEGGDADTNGAVTGSLLGAKYGLSGISSEWIDGLYDKQELDSKIDNLIKIMQIDTK
ncbi:MAG: ADP-ribosylglycohydrolase family protein [Desulfobacterales bacterium]|nr:ADP-ribosylglycohydrolase family protein [Desulfobacterales bacterium]